LGVQKADPAKAPVDLGGTLNNQLTKLAWIHQLRGPGVLGRCRDTGLILNSRKSPPLNGNVYPREHKLKVELAAAGLHALSHRERRQTCRGLFYQSAHRKFLNDINVRTWEAEKVTDWTKARLLYEAGRPNREIAPCSAAASER